jgi:hypothetical protein
MIYVTVYATPEGSYQVHLRDFLDPSASSADLGTLRPARSFAFGDTQLAVAFYRRLTSLPFAWMERIVAYGLPDELRQRFQGTASIH